MLDSKMGKDINPNKLIDEKMYGKEPKSPANNHIKDARRNPSFLVRSSLIDLESYKRLDNDLPIITVIKDDKKNGIAW